MIKYSIIYNFFLIEGTWKLRVKFLNDRRNTRYVAVKNCFHYCSKLDLDNKLKKITTEDLINNQRYILSLIIPADKRDIWDISTEKASKLRKIHSDYRYSLLHFKSINKSNYTKRYSYVSNIIS